MIFYSLINYKTSKPNYPCPKSSHFNLYLFFSSCAHKCGNSCRTTRFWKTSCSFNVPVDIAGLPRPHYAWMCRHWLFSRVLLLSEKTQMGSRQLNKVIIVPLSFVDLFHQSRIILRTQIIFGLPLVFF